MLTGGDVIREYVQSLEWTFKYGNISKNSHQIAEIKATDCKNNLIVFTWLMEGEDSYLPCLQRPLKQVNFCILACHICIVLDVAPLRWYKLGDISFMVDPIHVDFFVDMGRLDRWIHLINNSLPF